MAQAGILIYIRYPYIEVGLFPSPLIQTTVHMQGVMILETNSKQYVVVTVLL